MMKDTIELNHENCRIQLFWSLTHWLKVRMSASAALTMTLQCPHLCKTELLDYPLNFFSGIYKQYNYNYMKQTFLKKVNMNIKYIYNIKLHLFKSGK